MKKVMAGCLVLALLLTISLAPSDAWAGGRFHRGGGHFGFWGPGLFLGGLALGAAVSAPYYYRSGYPYYYGYGPDYYYAPPPAVVKRDKNNAIQFFSYQDKGTLPATAPKPSSASNNYAPWPGCSEGIKETTTPSGQYSSSCKYGQGN